MIKTGIDSSFLLYFIGAGRLGNFRNVDYLVVGHLTVDLLPPDENGVQKKILGGTAAYAALTAKAMGYEVGIVSGWGGEIPLDVLDGIQLCLIENEASTTFENIYENGKRKQYVHSVANPIKAEDIPELWLDSLLVHFAPIVNEVDLELIDAFLDCDFYLTPQGFLREWNQEGLVKSKFWADKEILGAMNAVVLSVEDMGRDQMAIESLVKNCPLGVVTHGKNGVVVYNNDKEISYSTDSIEEVDPTGAGDIFAASFFCCLFEETPLEQSILVAQKIAGASVRKVGMDSILSEDEILDILDEVENG